MVSARIDNKLLYIYISKEIVIIIIISRTNLWTKYGIKIVITVTRLIEAFYSINTYYKNCRAYFF